MPAKGAGTCPSQLMIWEFPKVRGTLFRGPYNKDPYYLGYYIGVPYFRKPSFRLRVSGVMNKKRRGKGIWHFIV